MADGKISFKGIMLSVQPRIRLIRSFDERSHNYLGYSLFIRGLIDDEREFSVGIGKAAQKKHQFCVGEEITGKECVPVADDRLEPVEFYKASKLKKTGTGYFYIRFDTETLKAINKEICIVVKEAEKQNRKNDD